MSKVKSVMYVVFSVVILISIVLGMQYLSVKWYRIIGTEIESTKTDVYRNNKSYTEGTVRDLRELRVEYEKAGDSHKSALKSLILQRANELDWERLTEDLRVFLEEIK